MATHLHEMDAPSLLRWMRKNSDASLSPSMLLDLIAVGLDRADWVTAHAADLRGSMGTVVQAVATVDGATLTESTVADLMEAWADEQDHAASI